MTREEWLIQRSVKQAAQDTGLHPDVINQVIQHESSGNPNALSSTGPQGLMQLSKAAAKEVGIDPNKRYNIQDNVKAGAAYLKKQTDRFGADKAYAAYHDGPGAVASGQPVSKEGQWTPTQPANVTREQWLANRHTGTEHTQEVLNPPPEDLASWKRGPAAYQRYKDMKTMPPGQEAMISAGHELNKLRAGTNELGYNLADMVGVPGMQAKVNAIAADQTERDKLYKEFSEGSGIPAVVGAMLPYLVDGGALGTPLAKLGGRVVGKLAAASEVATAEGRGLLARAVDYLAGMQTPVAKPLAAFGRRAQAEWTRPLARTAADRALQPAIVNPYLAGRGGELAGSAALGAAEGGLHYDRSMGEGAISSLLGTLTGHTVKPMLSNMPNFRAQNPTELELLDWGKSQGMRYLPGMETGSKRLQKFEHAMRADSSFADPIHNFDMANAIVNNRVAANVMGMDPAVVNAGTTTLSPDVLRAHDVSLGQQYDKLEAGTIAHFRPSDLAALKQHVSKTINDETIDDSLGRLVNGYYHKIEAMAPQRNPLTGQMQARVINGDNYKEIRRNLRSDINDAYASSDTRKADVLNPLLQGVDDAVERGVANKGGTASVADWKALNEKAAMTRLIKEHGMTPTGQYDPYRIMNHLMGSDASRMLTNGGGRINDLYRTAKLEYMAKHQMGSDLSGMGVKPIINSARPNLVEKLMMTPAAGYIDSFAPIPSAALKLYTKGWPAKTGLLNLSGKGKGDIALYTRALGESQQPYPSLYNNGKAAYDYGKAKVGGIQDYIEKYLQGVH